MKSSIFFLLAFIFGLGTCDEEPRLTRYGRWCGLNHGGFADCCNGGPCPQCNSYPPSSACLLACPPVDNLDAACASHDACWNKTPTRSCELGNFNECSCNCELTTALRRDSVCERASEGVRCRVYARAARALFCNYPCFSGTSCQSRLDHVCPSC